MITAYATAFLRTALGPVQVMASERGVLSVTFASSMGKEEDHPSSALRRCVAELEEYFSGKRKTFSVPLVMRGTDFQQRVWDALLTIPFGKTVTYGIIAKEIGSPLAVRAVGTAVGDNPLAIIIPCHRVLPAGGGIGEYASGSDRKEWLLRHERAIP